MPEHQHADFIKEAHGRRESIASQIAHLDEHDAGLRKAIENNGRARAKLRRLDQQYVEAIVRMGEP